MCYYFAYIAAETHISAIMVVLQDAVDPPFRPACVCVRGELFSFSKKAAAWLTGMGRLVVTSLS
jgi:hypothetical protein